MISTHEWMHVYQYAHALDLPDIYGSQIPSIGPIWLTEGMADYTGYKVTEKYGKVSYKKFINNIICLSIYNFKNQMHLSELLSPLMSLYFLKIPGAK